MEAFPVVSADSHVLEPPDLWTKRIGREWAARVPRLVAEETGDWWHADGGRLISVAAGVQPGIKYRPEEADWRYRTYEARWEKVRPGAYIPSEYVKDLELDGAAAGVAYPTIGLRHFVKIRDSGLFSAICRAYNEWLAEFCGAYPDRILGIAMVNLDDVEDGVAELRRAAGLGLKGAMITVYPAEDRPYERPAYEPFWAAAEDLGMPLSLHLATERPLFAGFQPEGGLINMALRVNFTQRSLGHIILSGVLERHPGLKVAVVEQDLAWAASFIDALDRVYQHKQWRPEFHKFKDVALPSDFFRRQVFIAFQDDRLGVELRSWIGVDNIMWGSDYPHPDGTFPHTAQVVERLFADVPPEEKRKMMCLNACRVYGLRMGGKPQ